MADIERAQRIIAAVAEGSSQRKALASEHMSWEKFHEICEQYPTLAGRFARAEELRADLLADDALEIADTDVDAQRARNRIDVRKWIAARLRPKKWGERIDVGVQGSIDLISVINEARRRIPVQDIDYTAFPSPTSTDDRSVPLVGVDIFS